MVVKVIETWSGTKWEPIKDALPLGQYVIRVREIDYGKPVQPKIRFPVVLQLVRGTGGDSQ